MTQGQKIRNTLCKSNTLTMVCWYSFLTIVWSDRITIVVRYIRTGYSVYLTLGQT